MGRSEDVMSVLWVVQERFLGAFFTLKGYTKAAA